MKMKILRIAVVFLLINLWLCTFLQLNPVLTNEAIKLPFYVFVVLAYFYLMNLFRDK